MKIQSFQELQVWQKGHGLVLEIYRITRTFPSDEKFGLISQIRRSSASVCANLAEGFVKSTKEFLRFIEIARASLEETKYHLILSRDLGYFNTGDYTELYQKTEEIGKMLRGLNKALRLKIGV